MAKLERTSSIKCGNYIYKQGDIYFGPAGPIPSLVCEVSYSERRREAERKAYQYIAWPGSPIQAVLNLNLQYPALKKAWVSLRVADGSSGYWSQYNQVFIPRPYHRFMKKACPGKLAYGGWRTNGPPPYFGQILLYCVTVARDQRVGRS